MSETRPRIGVVVVAYNAANTLAKVLDRIPQSFRSQISEVLVCDDHSDDATYLVGLGYKAISSDLPLTVIRHPRNLGYGGNQKEAYRVASEHGLNIVVLLHGDGQYAPELLPEMVAPLERGDVDAVFGSRMLESGAARRGGMPLYKLVGNRILTNLENRLLGTSMSEFHSGYRAYRVETLDSLPLSRNSDGFDFDTQIIVQLHDAGKKILEIPIPTYYGDEICYVNGLKYARDISTEVLRYRLGKMGFGSGPHCLPPPAAEPYDLKMSAGSSHGQILSWLGNISASKVLDLGCSDGALAEQLRKLGHYVVGVDVEEHEGVHGRVDRFERADLSIGIPAEVGDGYDFVLAADVLEHLAAPQNLVHEALRLLRPGGRLIACVPNIAHWYPRIRTVFGRFDYDRRGILDRSHLRFFTKRSFERLVRDSEGVVTRYAATGLPVEVFGKATGGIWRLLERIDRLATLVRPQLFGYQMLFEIMPLTAEDTPTTTVTSTVSADAKV